jgi:hypothetical protein
VAEGWRRLHSEELHNLLASPNIIRMINSRWIRWARQVARMGEMRAIYKILKGRDHLEDLGVDGKIIVE